MAAPKGNQFAKDNEGGRPTEYKREYNDQAYKLCLLGATDNDLADFFNVTEQTINNWKKEYEEFFESINAGKEIADMDVAFSLHQGTKDRIVTEKKGFKVKKVYYDENGKRVEEERIEMIDEERVIPSDFRNVQFWLKNRKPKQWRDKQEIDHTTKGKEINTSNLSEDERKVLLKIARERDDQ